eukprot:4466754-Pleurochrysis_carterae.AAC.1
MVSRLAMLERRHLRTHALTLDNAFVYHMRMADARGERRRTEIRSSNGGGLRSMAAERKADEKAAIGGGSNRSNVQQATLIDDTLAYATSCSRRP